MTKKNWETKNFYGEVWQAWDGWRGFFEHNEFGDEYGGGLSFEGKVLVDYDGIVGYVPKEVCDSLEEEGFDMEYGRDPDGDS